MVPVEAVEETMIVGVVASVVESVGDGVAEDGVPVDSPEVLRDNGEVEVAVGLVERVDPDASFDEVVVEELASEEEEEECLEVSGDFLRFSFFAA